MSTSEQIAAESAVPERSRILQLSAHPLFRCGGDSAFTCKACANVLVDGYRPRQLVALDLQCGRCGEVNRTDEWPPGEPLPLIVVSMGRSRIRRIDRTVEIDSDRVLITCDEEIDRVERATGIRPVQPDDMELSEDALASMEAQIGLWCPGLDVALRRTKVAFSRGNTRFIEFPPAWALVQLGNAIATGQVDLTGADGVALTYLRVTLHLLGRWAHHEQFPAIGAAFLYEFHHSTTQLVAASYLADVGNVIGLSRPAKDGGRTPDMFVNLDAQTRVGLEVKAPAELQWPKELPTGDRLQRVIKGKLKESKGQIGGPAGGLVIIGASIANAEFHDLSLGVLNAMADDGSIPSRISAVAVVNLAPHPTASGDGKTARITGADVFAVANPRYSGSGRVSTAPGGFVRKAVIGVA
ncbi:MAG TPA: hypothetical protein VFY73_12595 [Ideonella sp.]|uniref:hypothetical protein n=1 Tax=Ideonella sp. TaxID=1929293 RepID=UPI002E349971|nr:hypothetical protein [Ideonella sp.]HEX5684856.1 hypothetical protein [Ideonella sp.]